MNLNLKQAEIVDALKQYVSKQGFSLQGKSVKISFTAGRKDSGLSADVSIEDQDIPGVEEAPVAEVVKPVLTAVVTPITAVADTKAAEGVAVASLATEALTDAPFDGGVVVADSAANEAPVKTTSLFN